MLKKQYIIPAVTVIVAVAVGIVWLKPWKKSEGVRTDTPSVRQGEHPKGKKTETATKSGTSQTDGHRVDGVAEKSISMSDDLPPRDRKIVEAVQEALDNEDYAATIKAATEALKSTNAEVRLHAVEALGWFGKKALAELTPCMADPDEEVAQAAMNQWELALSDVDKSADRFDISFLALKVISNKDALVTIGSQFANAATDLIEEIDDEEKSSAKRAEVLQNVVDMIDDVHPARSAAAREIYEEITGHEWVSVEEAERYLSDPDNYEPPEDSGNEQSSTAEADSKPGNGTGTDDASSVESPAKQADDNEPEGEKVH